MKKMKFLVAALAAVAVCHQAFAQPDPTDPTLALWLNAGDLSFNDGDPVSLWTDASSFGTTFEPRTATLAGDPAEMNPVFVANAVNGQPAVRFVRDEANGLGDPAIPFSGGFDRLSQTSNLATPASEGADPLDIGGGNSLTAFVVFKSLGEGAWNNVIAKRGTNSSVYTIALSPDVNKYTAVTYDAITVYDTAESATLNSYNISALLIQGAAGPNGGDTYSFYENGAQLTSATNGGEFVARNPTTPEPFVLGGHSQFCCGDGEWFSGDIAEVIIYSRSLDPNEFGAIQDYLDTKYVPEPSSAVLLLLGGLFWSRLRRK